MLIRVLAEGRAPARFGGDDEALVIWDRIVAAAKGRDIAVQWVRAHTGGTERLYRLNRAADLRARRTLRAAVAGATPPVGPGGSASLPARPQAAA